jgi:hypothetical protein
MTSNSAELAHRLETPEHTVRRLRLVSGGLGITLITLLLVAAQSRSEPPVNVLTLPAATLIDTFMTRAAEYGQFNGAILVIDRGRRVYERAFGEANVEWHVPNTVDTRFTPGTDPSEAFRPFRLVHEFDGIVFFPVVTAEPLTDDRARR